MHVRTHARARSQSEQMCVHVFVYDSSRAIEAGEELSYNYYTSEGDENAKPVRCRCGADKCRGWL
jgi:SET domain-containing protein